jgi:flagellar biosynthesis protein FlhB
MGDSTEDKTEKPTFKKYKEAHDSGKVARSRDLSVAIAALAVVIALTRLGPALLVQLSNGLSNGLTRLGNTPTATISTVELSALVMSNGWVLMLAVGPILMVGGIAGLFGNVVQSQIVLAPLKLNFAALNPAQGLKKLAPKQSGVDLLKTALAVTVLSLLSWQIIRELLTAAPQLSWLSPVDAAKYGWGRLERLLWQCGFAMLVIAAGDFGVQKWRFYSSLKMTKQEVREEGKSAETNPEVKARVKKIQRDMSRSRMLKAVESATVVITNPTHYAVALEYRREKGGAPVVVAKGKDLMAARIRKIAREAGVPIMENVSLAQALYAGAEIGDAIPGALFGAVAEVLAYLVRIKQLML